MTDWRGACKIRKVSGELQMANNGDVSEDDIAVGRILARRPNPIGKL